MTRSAKWRRDPPVQTHLFTDGTVTSLKRLFRAFYGVRASHAGKPEGYWRRRTNSSMVKTLTKIANSTPKVG